MKLSRVEIITGISKIEPLKKALGKFHITGMTVYRCWDAAYSTVPRNLRWRRRTRRSVCCPKRSS